MAKHFWLRAETKKNEFRRAITPDACEKMIQAGHKITVEDWDNSIIPTSEYKNAGCEIAPMNSWIKDAPTDAIIVGLKALDNSPEVYHHTHIYFAHAYKEQDGWKELLTKFDQGGGKIIDLEFMVNENKRRVAAFGYWAGYVGAALGALFSKTTDEKRSIKNLKERRQFEDKNDLIDFVKAEIEKQKADAIIIGSKGRSGSGAIDFLNTIGWNTTGWDQKETAPGGPFKEILNHDLFVNCVLAMSKMPPFITKDLLEESTKLNMISDVSCDPDSECNMVPVYDKATVIDEPLFRVNDKVQLTAIDNLPSILPKESSYDFSSQLENYLIQYTEEEGPIFNALEVYRSCLAKI